MSEEEKKAIEELKSFINDKVCIYWIGKNGEETVKIILNLIDNQQKEIERLEARRYMYNAKTGEISQIPVDNNYISKDKIKAKIEEYNKMINATYEDFTHYADYRRDVCLEIKNALNELLEE